MKDIATSLIERLEKAVRMEGKGELEQARIRYRAVVDHDPDGLEALSLLGKVENKLGDHNAAFFHLRRAARIAPDRADIHVGVGNALAGVGEKRRAVKAYLDAVNADPNFAPAYISLGRVFAENRQPVKAERAFEAARQLGDAIPEVHYQLGVYYKESGRPAEALEAFEMALRLGGESDDLHTQLSELYLLSGRHKDALVHAHKQLRVDAKNTRAWTSLASVLLEMNSNDEAMNACQMALQCDPHNSVALAQIGQIHFSHKDVKGAKRSFDAAVKMDHTNNIALVGLAELCEYQGQHEAAMRYIREAGDPKAFSLNTALLCVRVLKSRQQTEAAIRLLKYRLENRLDHNDGRSRCHYMLARLYEERRDYKTAFSHYQNANDLIRSKHHDAWPRARVDEMLEFFTSTQMIKLSHAKSHATCNVVFVVGLPGLHMDLLNTLLSYYSQIHLSSGQATLVDVAEKLPQHLASARQFPHALTDARSAELQRVANQYFHTNLKGSSCASVLVDAQSNNASLLGLGRLLFPNVKVIQLTSDTGHAALDIYTQEHSGFSDGNGTSMRDVAAFAADQRRAMEHWSSINSIDMLQVKADVLLENPINVLQRIADHLGLLTAASSLIKEPAQLEQYNAVIKQARARSIEVKHFVEYLRENNPSVFGEIDRMDPQLG